MKKPEKKKLSEGQIWLIKMTRKNSCDCDYGYNQSCDDWEAFLPGEKEILEIMSGSGSIEDLAKEIAERIGK